MVTPHRKCVRMLHPLLKIVFSSRLVSTLAITTHAPTCCEDCARLVADKLANGKEPKETPGLRQIAIQLVYFIEIWARNSSRREASKTFKRVEDFRCLSYR